MTRPLRIGIVAGELSGDILGAGFIRAIQMRYPDAEFVGIGGPQMMALGCQSLFDMDELSVMGIVEVLGRLRRLFQVKAKLVEYFIQNPPDVFIGVDAPDFNLRLERKLKDQGIKTVHYVSPSVWAWRQHRIHGIAKATNLVLAFLPFEKAFYDRFNVPCTFVGHTLADQIPLDLNQIDAQIELGLSAEKRWISILPGSRGGEMSLLAPVFIETCRQLQSQNGNLGFVVALVNEKRRAQFESAWKEFAPELDFTLIDGTARTVIAASEVVLLASGTVALECMLINRPMVVGYKVKPVTAWIAKRLLKTKYVSLPNILADKPLVGEYLQEDCTPDKLANAMNDLLNKDQSAVLNEFKTLHQTIRCNADEKAAQAVLELISKA
jgi:lipid-A-disaccharide synthase